MMHDWSWGGGWMMMGPLYIIIWAAILVAVIMLVIRWIGSSDASPPRRTTARDILDERFARGEIEQDEYEKRRAVLDR